MALERQVRAKIAAKRDPQQEKEAQEWIEAIIGRKFNTTFEDYLRDGQVLCELINKIQPGSVTKINTSGGDFKMMENINKFQKAIQEYGVPDIDVFQTVELWEKKDIGQVITTLFALGRETYRHSNWQGPYLGPKPADECKRDFTEEQLNAGKTVIGLQAGSNKGATQAGQNMGASRKILLGK
ncbi:muscle-specific protein 20 [Nasonia vitripennis]|uniref:Calponin n=1 Tax=Nasonia vitripennis TaxID=7425 RepID=A0A7M7LIR2_NASVI|nr:muscle-specific protein 20 [Nasonia vitripennis]